MLFDGRLEVAVPTNYALYERPDRVEFLRFGGNAAPSREFSHRRHDATFLDESAGKDVQASIRILLIDLTPTGEPHEWKDHGGTLTVPRDASPRAIHNHFCEGFASHWGHKYSFATFDPKTGIGRCVNFVGAFVAVFTRWVGDTLVVAEGLDMAEVLIFERKGPGRAFLEMPTEEKWKAIRAAANTDVTEQVLLSARVLPKTAL